MEILVDIRHLTKGNQSGVGRYTTSLLAALFELDTPNKYNLLTTGIHNPSLPQELTEHKNVEHIHSSVANKLLSASVLLSNKPTLPEVSKTKPDLLFLPNLNITSIPKELPYVLTLHDLSWKLMPEFFSRKMRLWHKATRAEKLITQAKEIIVPSESTKRDVCVLFNRSDDSVHVIHHATTEDFNDKKTPADQALKTRLNLPKNFALFVGTIEPRKNLESVIVAMEKYRRESGNQLQLVVAGGIGWKADRLVKILQKHSWIKYIGYVKTEDLPSLYRTAQVFIWPSFYEGFGLPILEAMSCGTPVITSNHSSLAEVTAGNALLIDPNDPGDIVKSLHQLHKNKELSLRLIQNGLKRASQFSWSESAKQTQKIFEKAINNKTL